MGTTTSFEQFQIELGRLVVTFEKGFKDLIAPDYPEARLREDFLNPFFRALGWDMENKGGLVQSQREVEIESRTDVAGRTKRADYLFRVDNRERFVCEAKKPREVLGDRYAFQTKRYAWNKGLPLAILSDFEEIKIYIVGGKPHIDRAEEGLWKTWTFHQYPLVAREIWELLARERIVAGSIAELLDSLPKAKPVKGKARQQWLIRPERTKALDQDFLEYLDEHRRSLASDLFVNNEREDLLADGRLNEAAQRILDRLLFLRICEDRDVDTGRRLADIVETWRRAYGHEDQRKLKQGRLLREEEAEYKGAAPRESLWWAVVSHLRALDRRPPGNMPFFNGNLFKSHFSEDLRVGDQWLCDFIEEISADESPYLFSVIPVEILGSVYERFLGKVVRPQGRGVTIEEKPEVRKAGGVYYTPRYIVNYIVEQTVGHQLNAIVAADKAFAAFDKKTRVLRILDPACGSGSFLIRAFERVCEHYQRRFMARTEDRKPKLCWTDPNTGDVHLTVDLKRRILRDNIYGVDLDAQAVEVTQLSLYLKMLEGEDRTSIERQRELFRDDAALLPPLEDNIKHGNSLIASDFSLVPEDLVRVHAFDWDVQFAEIMKAGGFDAVIGNPPYIRIQTMQETDPESANYLNTHFAAAAKGNYDIYVVFIERALSLLNPRGRQGYIVPHKFFNAQYGEALRKHLCDGRHIWGITHFGHQQVFDGATTYTCLLFTQKAPADQIRFVKVDDLGKWAQTKNEIVGLIPTEKVTAQDWVFAVGPAAALLDKLRKQPATLESSTDRIFQGLKTSADKIYIVEERKRRGRQVLVWSPEKGAEYWLEDKLLHPLIKGGDSHRYSLSKTSRLILFPYKQDTDGKMALLTQAELKTQYPKSWDYLCDNRNYLDNREEGRFRGLGWYQFGRSQALDVMSLPKLFTPDLAARSSFSLDDTGECFFTGGVAGGYGILAKPGVAPKYLLALLNSRLLNWIISQTGTQMRGGYFSFEARFIRSLPIAQPEAESHDKLVELVDKMLALTPKLRAETNESKRKTLQNAVDATDRQIDQLVYELYGLTEEEIRIVEGKA